MARTGPPATKLQAARIAQGYTQASLIHAMIRRARELHIPIAARTSLHTMLSRWENGKETVTDLGYRRLFREILGRTNEELGFPEEPVDDGIEDLRQRIAVAHTLDATTVELFRRQVDNIRHLDRRLGAATLLEQISAQVTEIENLLIVSPETPLRAKLARVLADAIGQQAVVLLDLGETQAAAAQIDYARQLGTSAAVPALLATWLTAAHGEALAATGNRDAALTALNKSRHPLPIEHNHPDLPFTLLSEGHLSRWRGSALTRLGEHEAINELEHALHTITTNTARAQTAMLTDLAFAHAATGDRDAALAYASQARRLANQIGSDRQRRRLTTLILPISGSPTRTT